MRATLPPWNTWRNVPGKVASYALLYLVHQLDLLQDCVERVTWYFMMLFPSEVICSGWSRIQKFVFDMCAIGGWTSVPCRSHARVGAVPKCFHLRSTCDFQVLIKRSYKAHWSKLVYNMLHRAIINSYLFSYYSNFTSVAISLVTANRCLIYLVHFTTVPWDWKCRNCADVSWISTSPLETS